MKFSFPFEITNYILFEFIDEIDYRIRFKKIRKLEINNFQNIINNFNNGKIKDSPSYYTVKWLKKIKVI